MVPPYKIDKKAYDLMYFQKKWLYVFFLEINVFMAFYLINSRILTRMLILTNINIKLINSKLREKTMPIKSNE